MKEYEYTVLINVLNGEAFILEALSQVQNQTIQAKRIVVVNNGSRDNTLEMLNQAARDNDRIKIVNIESTVPLYRARNVGLKEVATRYVAFLDVDDLWERDKCERQMREMGKGQRLIACTTNHTILYSSAIGEEQKKDLISTRISTENIVRDYSVHFSSVMLDLDRISSKDKESLFCNKMTILGDLDFFARFCSEENWFNIELPLTSYLYHEGNTGYRKFYRVLFESLILSLRLLLAGRYKEAIDSVPFFLEKTVKSYALRLVKKVSR